MMDERIVRHEWNGNEETVTEVGEIVRCKDCQFGYISEFAPPEMRDIWCCARNHILSTVKPDFFCGDGKPKDGEQDG